MQQIARTCLSLILLTSYAMYTKEPVVTSENIKSHIDIHKKYKRAVAFIDPQYGFCVGGDLPVAAANTPFQEDLKAFFAQANATRISKDNEEAGEGEIMTAITKDWHPSDHVSFITSHPDRPDARLYAPLTLADGSQQMMWPPHCEQGKKGAETFLDEKQATLVVHKGTNKNVEEYSGAKYLIPSLHAHGVQEVTVCGIAGDYCVPASAHGLIDDGQYNGANGKQLHVIANLSPSVDPKKGAEEFLALQQKRAKIWFLRNIRNQSHTTIKLSEVQAITEQLRAENKQIEELKTAGIDVYVTTAADYFGQRKDIIIHPAQRQQHASQ